MHLQHIIFKINEKQIQSKAELKDELFTVLGKHESLFNNVSAGEESLHAIAARFYELVAIMLSI